MTFMRTDSRTRTYLITLIAVAAVDLLTIYLSLFLVPAGSGASIVWPPAAVALVALFLFGMDLWPALLIPFFFLLLIQGVAPPVAAAVALSHTLSGYVAAALLRRLSFSPMLARLQDALILIFAAVVAPLVSATIITGALDIFSTGTWDSTLWLGLWIGHFVSLLAFGPFALRWAYKPFFTRTVREWLLGAALFGAFTALNVLLYWTSFTAIASVSLLYISIIPLIWIALRTGPRGMSLALLLMALTSSLGLFFGHDLFSQQSSNVTQALFGVQLIIGTLSVIFLLFSTIVEERKEATVALKSHVGQLEVALDTIRSEDQAKSDFIAILAHELRNPLSPLMSGLELLKVNEQGPQDILQMMGAHLHTMARLLDDLLDMSRISQKKFRLQRQPVKLGDVMEQVLEMARPIIDEHQHQLLVSLPQEDLWLDGDQVRLAQLFVNLLTNAAKYTPKGGTIRVRIERRGNSAVVEVSDNGIGIDPDRLKKIFEPFGVGDHARAAQGLHIGLSLAKRMAELHQGEISVASGGRGRGSSFVVRLPLLVNAPLPLEPTKQSGRSRFNKEEFKASRLNPLTILVVDDNEAAAEALARLLEHGGHTTLVAHDAPEALKLLNSHEPQAALLDIGLPGMDGYELAARVRERLGEDILLIALTGYGQAEDKQKAHNAGFDAHLTKPVSIVDIERALADLAKA